MSLFQARLGSARHFVPISSEIVPIPSEIRKRPPGPQTSKPQAVNAALPSARHQTPVSPGTPRRTTRQPQPDPTPTSAGHPADLPSARRQTPVSPGTPRRTTRQPPPDTPPTSRQPSVRLPSAPAPPPDHTPTSAGPHADLRRTSRKTPETLVLQGISKLHVTLCLWESFNLRVLHGRPYSRPSEHSTIGGSR